MGSLEESCPGPLDAPQSGLALELLARAQAGNAEALDELIRRYHERLLRIVRIRLGPTGTGLRRFLESADIAQETWKAALGALDDLRVRGEPDLLAWLARIATNEVRDQLDRVRAQRRSLEREQPLPSEAGGEPIDPHTDPGARAARGELAEILDQAIAELPEHYREVILLRDYCGSDWETIAPRVGSPSVHAAQQLHQRAWIRVRRLAAPRLG